jgi:hypothetical protein
MVDERDLFFLFSFSPVVREMKRAKPEGKGGGAGEFNSSQQKKISNGRDSRTATATAYANDLVFIFTLFIQ